MHTCLHSADQQWCKYLNAAHEVEVATENGTAKVLFSDHQKKKVKKAQQAAALIVKQEKGALGDCRRVVKREHKLAPVRDHKVYLQHCLDVSPVSLG
jgi:hypothetical protein